MVNTFILDQMVIGDIFVENYCLVLAESSDFDMIVGISWIRRMGATLDMAYDTITLNSKGGHTSTLSLRLLGMRGPQRT